LDDDPRDDVVALGGEHGSPAEVTQIQFQVASQTDDPDFDFCLREVSLS
jgi:hypothetical protein